MDFDVVGVAGALIDVIDADRRVGDQVTRVAGDAVVDSRAGLHRDLLFDLVDRELLVLGAYRGGRQGRLDLDLVGNRLTGREGSGHAGHLLAGVGAGRVDLDDVEAGRHVVGDDHVGRAAAAFVLDRDGEDHEASLDDLRVVGDLFDLQLRLVRGGRTSGTGGRSGAGRASRGGRTGRTGGAGRTSGTGRRSRTGGAGRAGGTGRAFRGGQAADERGVMGLAVGLETPGDHLADVVADVEGVHMRLGSEDRAAEGRTGVQLQVGCVSEVPEGFLVLCRGGRILGLGPAASDALAEVHVAVDLDIGAGNIDQRGSANRNLDQHGHIAGQHRRRDRKHVERRVGSLEVKSVAAQRNPGRVGAAGVDHGGGTGRGLARPARRAAGQVAEGGAEVDRGRKQLRTAAVVVDRAGKTRGPGAAPLEVERVRGPVHNQGRPGSGVGRVGQVGSDRHARSGKVAAVSDRAFRLGST